MILSPGLRGGQQGYQQKLAHRHPSCHGLRGIASIQQRVNRIECIFTHSFFLLSLQACTVERLWDGGLLLALDTSFPTGLFLYNKFPYIIYYNIFVIKSKYCVYTGRARMICILARPPQRRYTGLKTGGGLIEGANRL